METAKDKIYTLEKFYHVCKKRGHEKIFILWKNFTMYAKREDMTRYLVVLVNLFNNAKNSLLIKIIFFNKSQMTFSQVA